ncbi:MAG: hypothetical protein LBU64_13555 [Planctomycetota bacterium]|jgi:hypothetical protein|nr:hypothetical protein [Planctomycetota bacterium]
MPILFNEAMDAALAILERHPEMLAGAAEVVLVRDLRGRMRPLLAKPAREYNQSQRKKLESEFETGLGKYGFPAPHSVLYADSVEMNSQIRDQTVVLKEAAAGMPRILLLDRQIIGNDWLRRSLPRETGNPRAVFFSVKGGTGRSTAIFNWAYRLAAQGRKVLVLDLDLESPGLSNSLLDAKTLPDFGIVDWFVEDAVGQADLVADGIIGISHLSRGLDGEILAAPCQGKRTGQYLPKLARCYAEYDGKTFRPWAERLGSLVSTMEEKLQPDLTLIDSRAGLNDIAAALVCRLDAAAFLFAVNTRQTWAAYRGIFETWQRHPEKEKLRGRLKMVYGLMPETLRKECLGGFLEQSEDAFREMLYDEVKPGSLDGFYFETNDPDAPHYPLVVNWHRALQEYHPRTADDLDGKLLEEVYVNFFDSAAIHADLPDA